MRLFVASLALAAVPAAAASAQIVEEVHVGVTQHNVCIANCDNANKEDGPNINGEIVFASPELLDIIWSPRPYVVASVNTAGDTSFGGAGLHWNWDFAGGWSLEPGLGYVIHDGELTFPIRRAILVMIRFRKLPSSSARVTCFAPASLSTGISARSGARR